MNSTDGQKGVTEEEEEVACWTIVLREYPQTYIPKANAILTTVRGKMTVTIPRCLLTKYLCQIPNNEKSNRVQTISE